MENGDATVENEETNLTPAHVALQHLGELLKDTKADGPALQNLKTDFGYMAPELEEKRWNKMWVFILEHVIPFDTEDWTTPVRHYWQAVVPSTRKNVTPIEQASSE